MSDFDPFDPFDPVKAVMGALHKQNLLAAKDAEIANLKAEVERLRASSFVTAVPIEQYERLVKAGDAMADKIRRIALLEIITPWLAAKEGKPNV